MKKGYSDIAVVLDRSGSMASVIDDTIGGFNTFLKSQKDVEGEATISLYQFNDGYEAVYENKDIKNVEELSRTTFVPCGNTALYEAIARTIDNLGDKYRGMKEEDRPERVFLIIITDGEENASNREYTFESVKERITHQQNKYNWKVAFLGSELKSVHVAQGMGLSKGSTLNYTNNSRGISGMYCSTANSLTSLRSCSLEEFGELDMFSEADQKAQDEARI